MMGSVFIAPQLGCMKFKPMTNYTFCTCMCLMTQNNTLMTQNDTDMVCGTIVTMNVLFFSFLIYIYTQMTWR